MFFFFLMIRRPPRSALFPDATLFRSGAVSWSKRYNGPGNAADAASSVAVSPDGSKVFVTGQSARSTSCDAYTTESYKAATGSKSRIKRYNGSGNAADAASLVAGSPHT